MRVSFSLTLDGLVRALRGTLHDVAERAEGGYGDGMRESGPVARRMKESSDDDRSSR